MFEVWEGLTGGFTTADLVLWAVGWGALVVFLLPIAVTALGLRLVRFVPVEEPSALEPDGTNPEYDSRYAELAELGFRPLGVVREHTWLHMHEWHKCFPVRVLIGPDGMTFATLYDLSWNGMIRVGLSTVTEAGVLIQTAMPGAGIPAEEPDYRRREVPWGPVSDLLAVHRGEVEGHVRRSGDRPARTSLTELAALDERISVRQLRDIGNGFINFYPVIGWLVPFLLTLGVVSAFGDVGWPRRVGVSLLVAGFWYLVFAFKLMPALHRLAERCEAEERQPG